MAQDHRHSLRILQTQLKKPSSDRLLYLLLGFILGILCTGIIFFIYNNFSKTADSVVSNPATSDTQNSVNQHAQVPQSTTTRQNTNAEHDEQNYAPIKDNELSGLFKHEKNQPKIIQNLQTNSPFENAFGNSNKPKTADTQRPAKILKPIAAAVPKMQIKETANQTPTAKLTQSKTLSKEADTEIPPASLKISVTRTEIES